MALEGLGGLIKGLEDQDSWQVQRQFRLVVQHWPKAVGFAVARKTRPVGIQRGTLYVATATAVWAQTLTYERIKILRKLNRHQRQPLKGIRFSTAQWAQPVTPKVASSSTRHPSYVERVEDMPAAVRSPQTATEAFAHWSVMVQKMQQNQAQCPQCQCHCPQGELERWQVCSLCASKRWALTTRQ
ncbi:MAG: DUF721 domain-containing protein [Cyanobacteria bacterium J06581_3]